MLEFLLLLIGIFIGGICVWFVYEKKIISAYRKEQTALKELAANEQQKRKAAETETELTKKLHHKLLNNYKENFDAIISRSILNNNDQFVKLAEKSLEKIVHRAVEENKIQKNEIQHIVSPLNETLRKQEEMIKNFRIDSGKTLGSLHTHLTDLMNSQKSLQKETNALVSALKSPKVRGRWGEIGLQRIVEFSGMSSYCGFDEQVHVKDKDRILRPDMIIHLPENKKIVVDSKVPLNAYLDAVESSDDTEKAALMKRHAQALNAHMKELSSKAYWSQFDNSVDFVVLYIEVEPAFGAALHENKLLLEAALKNRIVFATPTTLIALLQTIAFSWKQHDATENALEIWKLSNDLYERLANFNEYIEKIGSTIHSLVKNFNQAVGSWENRVLPGVRKMQNKGVGSKKKKVGTINAIEMQTRELKKSNETNRD